jgi:hypothetical protein
MGLFDATPKEIGNGFLNTSIGNIAGKAILYYILFRVIGLVVFFVILFIFAGIGAYIQSKDCYIGKPDNQGVIQEQCSYKYPHGFIPPNEQWRYKSIPPNEQWRYKL